MRPARQMWRDAAHAWRMFPVRRRDPRPWIRTRETWAARADLRLAAFDELRRFERRRPWCWLPRRVVIAAFAAFGVSDGLGERLTRDHEEWRERRGDG